MKPWKRRSWNITSDIGGVGPPVICAVTPFGTRALVNADPPGPLWDSLRATCAYICAQYGIAPTELYGHRDYRNTICPGDRLYGTK